MVRFHFVVFSLLLLAGCGFQIPNGVFACVGSADCPSGYSCWNRDGLCYDADEPESSCQPASCEEVAAQFTLVGVRVECGTLPDGCGGFVECPPCGDGEVCGASGQNFVCGCEPATCSAVGAECGEVPLGCGVEGSVNCGPCPGGLECGSDNRCFCPAGQDCDAACGGCLEGQVCDRGECCDPVYPCSENECSPEGGLDDGCGKMVDCGACSGTETCQLQAPMIRFACIDECTCEAQGLECGTVDLCGTSQLCGFCGEATPICDDGRCVCSDIYEPNETPTDAAELDCDGSCPVGSIHAEVEGSIEDANDVDFYTLEVPHRTDRAIRVEVAGLGSTREISLSYVCPDGSERIDDCSGSSSSIGDTKYCFEDSEDVLRLVQRCDGGTGSGATVLVAVAAKEGEFRGLCDSYTLTVSSYSYDD